MSENSWDFAKIAALYEQPFLELIYRAHTIHKANFDPNEIELCQLFSIKTGLCPEDCGYCSQSGHHNTGVVKEKLFAVDEVIAQAKKAKALGAQRFCMGAAWRNPPKKDFPKVLEMISAVKNLGLETCVTLGNLDQEQAHALKEAGLDFYNHNIDSSREYYESKVVSTHTYDDRLNTINHVSDAKINVCCGGIMGMGESRADRINFLLQLTQLPTTLTSLPINRLSPVKGTPLGDVPPIDNFEFVRTIAIGRILFPTARIRIGAGRSTMSEELQSLCFMAGANSIFISEAEKMLTALVPNPKFKKDLDLFEKLGLRPQYES